MMDEKDLKEVKELIDECVGIALKRKSSDQQEDQKADPDRKAKRQSSDQQEEKSMEQIIEERLKKYAKH
ncbi:MAG: hypothetical protein LUE14_09560 [Clostridiales bacterium]|nr:hypothetical protein [Clostridiales bacterium]